MPNIANVADMYRQATGALHLYQSKSAREAGMHLHHLAIGAEWLAGRTPAGFAEDSWMWDAMREAIRSEGGAVRRRNAGGGFTESYLDGDRICTRQIAAVSTESA